MNSLTGYVPNMNFYASSLAGLTPESLILSEGDSGFYDSKYKSIQAESAHIVQNLQSTYIQEVIMGLKRVLVVNPIFFWSPLIPPLSNLRENSWPCDQTLMPWTS